MNALYYTYEQTILQLLIYSNIYVYYRVILVLYRCTDRKNYAFRISTMRVTVAHQSITVVIPFSQNV
jgi:hypothetical protein